MEKFSGKLNGINWSQAQCRRITEFEMAVSRNIIYAVWLTCLSFICFILASVAVGIPIWGYFDNPTGGWDGERGYFGPWNICKKLSYNREKCGNDVSRFKSSLAVYVSGILSASSTVVLGIICILSIIQIAMISSGEKIVMKYSVLLMLKMVLSLLATIFASIATVVFAIQIDNFVRKGYVITRGVSFYIEIVVVVLTIALFVMSVYDVSFSKKSGGNPTISMDTSLSTATTYNNPGYRERRNKPNVSVTDNSGKPYAGLTNGSMASMSTTVTNVSNESTVESNGRSPLRSSLKKPRSRDTLGIHNPGFSGLGHSPPLHRNGSMKKVRIQTHSTEV